MVASCWIVAPWIKSFSLWHEWYTRLSSNYYSIYLLENGYILNSNYLFLHSGWGHRLSSSVFLTSSLIEMTHCWQIMDKHPWHSYSRSGIFLQIVHLRQLTKTCKGWSRSFRSLYLKYYCLHLSSSSWTWLSDMCIFKRDAKSISWLGSLFINFIYVIF